MALAFDLQSIEVVGYDAGFEQSRRRHYASRDEVMGRRIGLGMASCAAAQAADRPELRAITEALAAQVVDATSDNAGSQPPAITAENVDFA